jgi:transposase, IS6 family
MMLERGLQVDHTTISRWVQQYAPELDRRCRSHLKTTTDSRAGLTNPLSREKRCGCPCIGRSIPRERHSIFSSRPTRDEGAAKRFLLKTLAAPHTSEPRVINVDKNVASPKAFGELKAAGHLPESCALRQVKYLNNLIEQDHRFIKRLTKLGMGCFSDLTAWRTLQGYEIMNMMRKGQVRGVAKGDVRGQVTLIARLFGVAG